jgi:hypothetical protein
MRKESAHQSEMVSQLLFGEFAEVLEEQKDFIRVKCLFDQYEGWCQRSQLEFADTVRETDRYLVADTESIYMEADRSIPITFGTPVYGGPDDEIQFGKKVVTYDIGEENIWRSSEEVYNAEQIRFIAEHYLETSYLWGGKTVYGIDCSGFVQQVFKFFNLKLPRDAWQQAEVGEDVNFGDHRIADLAFFKNENGRITHVGLVLEDGKIIHASGRVRVDDLKEDGIFSSENGIQSHTFHSLRRVLS